MSGLVGFSSFILRSIHGVFSSETQSHSSKTDEKPNLIEFLSPEILEKVFILLPRDQLSGPVALVCKVWNQHISDPKFWAQLDLKYLPFPVIDESVWRRLAPQLFEQEDFSSDENLKPLNHLHAYVKMMRIWKRCGSMRALPMSQRGFSLLTIPKGLSINLLLSLFPNRIRFISDSILERLGEIKVERSYRIFISEGILNKSLMTHHRGSWAWEDDVQFPHRDLMKKLDCTSPKVIEAMSIALLRDFTSFGQAIPISYPMVTFCQKELGRWALEPCVSFHHNGLFVCKDKDEERALRDEEDALRERQGLPLLYDHYTQYGEYGAVGVWKS